MSKCRIYYEDNEYSGDPFKAKNYGVICILQQRKDGYYHIVSNFPYYIFVGGYWLGAWENDLVDYLMHKPKVIEILLMGRLVPKHIFSKIYKQAQSDRQKENI